MTWVGTDKDQRILQSNNYKIDGFVDFDIKNYYTAATVLPETTYYNIWLFYNELKFAGNQRIKKKRRIYYLTEKAKETENIGVKTLAYKLKEYNKLITWRTFGFKLDTKIELLFLVR